MSLPKRGMAPIKCGKRGCKWRGYETEMKQVPHPTVAGTISVCPTCGNESYMFMTKGEIADWERKKQLPLCAVRGIPGAGMACGHVIVGGKHCGSKDQCEHQRKQEAAV